MIMENGDIISHDNESHKHEYKTVNDARPCEFRKDKNKPEHYNEWDNGSILPKKFNFEVDKRFWTMNKEIVQNAIHCSMASYNNSPDGYLKAIGTQFLNTKVERKCSRGKGQKCVMSMVSTTLYVAFQGTDPKDLNDVLTDLDLKMVNDNVTWPEQHDMVKFHEGFLARCKEWIKTVEDKVSFRKRKLKVND